MRVSKSNAFMALASIFNFFLPIASVRIDPNCDFPQDMETGVTYYIYNQQYPDYYPPSTSCRWSARSPTGTNIVLSCEEINLPSSVNCQGDRLSVSLTGDPNLNDAHNYCGKGSTTFITEGNALTVGLFSTSNSVGGRFVCSMTVMQNGPTTTTEDPAPCDCGFRRGTRIVGGEEAGVNEFPLMAVLLDSVDRRLFCGGSIISEFYVLTAAHCFNNRVLEDTGVLVGDHNISSSTDTPYAALYRVAEFIIHEEYGSSIHRNDIGLVRCASPIQFSAFVGPVCLPFRYTGYSFDNQDVILLGYGNTVLSGSRPDSLQKVVVQVRPNPECSVAQTNLDYRQMCTWSQGKDSCYGDSGGPTLYQDPNTRKLILAGIISYGSACANAAPAVETRVTAYLDWIVKHTQGAAYCIK